MFRLTSEPMRFPPLAVIGSSPRVLGARNGLRGGLRERRGAARARRSPESRNGAKRGGAGRNEIKPRYPRSPCCTTRQAAEPSAAKPPEAEGTAGRGPERNPGSRRAPCRRFGAERVESPARQNKRRAFPDSAEGSARDRAGNGGRRSGGRRSGRKWRLLRYQRGWAGQLPIQKRHGVGRPAPSPAEPRSAPGAGRTATGRNWRVGRNLREALNCRNTRKAAFRPQRSAEAGGRR